MYVSGTYWALIWDVSTGLMCWGWSPMPTMGAPGFAQFQSENSNNPIGGTFQVPNFNVWYSPSIAFGFPNDLRTWVVKSSTVPGVVVNAMSYNSAACAGTSLSCFQET